jgi:Carboxypeptidase regulatory-like domain
MRFVHTLLGLAILTVVGCHPGPVVGPGSKKLDVGGTIAGIVSTDTNAPVSGRKVTAIETTSGARFDATTGANGGFTIKVPQGTYRLEIELQAGESVVKQPSETQINKSDLDPKRDFVIRLGG